MKINYEQSGIDIDEIDFNYHHVVGFIGENPYIIKRVPESGEYFWDGMITHDNYSENSNIANLVELEYLKNRSMTSVEVFQNMIDVFKYVYDYLANYDSPTD